MTKINKTLKPCPFCGNKNISVSGNLRPNGKPMYSVGCFKCDFSPLLEDAPSKDFAIKSWNSRVYENEEAEHLRKQLDIFYDIVDNSNGVSGYHLNGDVASWDELL